MNPQALQEDLEGLGFTSSLAKPEMEKAVVRQKDRSEDVRTK